MSVVLPPERLPIDHANLKTQVKQMCFDMLLHILKEAENENPQSMDRSARESQKLVHDVIRRLSHGGGSDKHA
jgi:hypothetical protein